MRSTFNEVNDSIAPVSIYFLKYFILVYTFMTKFSPKRNNYFFFSNPRDLIMNCMKVQKYTSDYSFREEIKKKLAWLIYKFQQ